MEDKDLYIVYPNNFKILEFFNLFKLYIFDKKSHQNILNYTYKIIDELNETNKNTAETIISSNDYEKLKLNYLIEKNLFKHYYSISLDSEKIDFFSRIEWIVDTLIKDIKSQVNINLKLSFLKDYLDGIKPTLVLLNSIDYYERQLDDNNVIDKNESEFHSKEFKDYFLSDEVFNKTIGIMIEKELINEEHKFIKHWLQHPKYTIYLLFIKLIEIGSITIHTKENIRFIPAASRFFKIKLSYSEFLKYKTIFSSKDKLNDAKLQKYYSRFSFFE